MQINQNRKTTSNRIRAANKFLSNISLDGSVQLHDDVKKTIDKHEQELLSHPQFLQTLHKRPKLLTSFSATNASEDEENIEPSVSTSFQRNVSMIEGSAVKLKGSNIWTNNLIYTTNKPLAKYQDLPGKRIMMCSAHSIPFAVYSMLKYTQQEKGDTGRDKNTYRLRRISGDHDCDSYGIKGVDMGSQDKPVSYGHLLVPAGSLITLPKSCFSPRKNTGNSNSPGASDFPSYKSSSFGSHSDISCSSPGTKSPRVPSSYTEPATTASGSCQNYDPVLLDDPEFRSGRHRKVLHLNSFLVSIIEYVKPSQLKKDLNEQFKEKFPNMEISLSKLRSLKHDLIKLSAESSLDDSTVAFAFVYFEKLILAEKINKINRKLIAGSCLLLAAKFNNDLNKSEVEHLMDKLSDWFRVSKKDLFLFEIQALIALEFNLHLPDTQILPHIKRLEYGVTTFM